VSDQYSDDRGCRQVAAQLSADAVDSRVATVYRRHFHACYQEDVATSIRSSSWQDNYRAANSEWSRSGQRYTRRS